MHSTSPKPSDPALLHKDTTLHGAPTVEDTFIWSRQKQKVRNLCLYLLHLASVVVVVVLVVVVVVVFVVVVAADAVAGAVAIAYGVAVL